MSANDDPQLPLFGEAPKAPPPALPEPPEGFAYYVVAKGAPRVLGRTHCVVNGPRIEVCFALKHVLGWFGWDDRVKLGMEMLTSMTSDAECDGVVLKKGRGHWADFKFCPFCGKGLDAKLAPPARDGAPAPTEEAADGR